MILDVLVLVIIAISTLIAFWRGFVREALTIVTLGLSATGGYFLGSMLDPFMLEWLGGEGAKRIFGIIKATMLSAILARMSVFLVIFIILSIATHMFSEFIKSIGLGAVDRSLGAVFGIVRAVFVCMLLYLPAYFIVSPESKGEWLADSRSHVYLEQGAQYLAGFIPSNFVDDKLEGAQQAAQSDVVQSARDKLQAMDLLRPDLNLQQQAEHIRQKYESGELDNVLQQQGYSDDFRNQLDNLIQEQLRDNPSISIQE